MCGISGYDITSWTHTFDQVGTYAYHDYAKQNYPQRPNGVVNVVASGAPSPSSQADAAAAAEADAIAAAQAAGLATATSAKSS